MSRNENINVSLRFRPLSPAELEESESNIWTISKNTVSLKPDCNQYLIDCKKLTGQARSYTYSTFYLDYCFTSNDSNLLIYSTVAKPIIYASLEGYNGTIFAYGQTGSGKTYTMMGSEGSQEPPAPKKREMHSVSPSRKAFFREGSSFPRMELPKEKGIVVLALEDLFAAILNNFQRTYYLTCSYLEIYNEHVYDLLADNMHVKAEVLTVNEDEAGFYVNGLSEHGINSIEEVLQWIRKGEGNRKYAATAMNHHSSRSHTIFRINVTSIRVLPDTEDGSVTTESILNFVDLAGSERVSTLIDSAEPRSRSSQKTENLLNEGKHINTSLFYLCQIINKLSEKSMSKADVHIPYRNSNLTKILSTSIGGNSLTSIICTATPILSQFEMTLSTLRFGGTARTITNTVEANVKSNKNSELLKSYQKDLDILRKELEDAQQGGKEIDDSNVLMKKQLEDRISKLNHLLIQDDEPQQIEEEEEDVWVNEVWNHCTGYLRLDPRLGKNQQHRLFCKNFEFEDKGAVVFERMKAMNIELKAKNREIRDLNEAKSFLQDSKVNVSKT